MKNFYFLLLSLFVFSGVNAQVIDIPDVNFKAKLLAAGTTNEIAKDLNGNNIKIDTNNNSEIEPNEALQVYALNVGNTSLSSANPIGISSLYGISNFSNLTSLNCNLNLLISFDLIGLTNLKHLECNNNQLTSLDVSSLTNLQTLSCGSNQLNSLYIDNLANLQYIDCSNNNELTSLSLIDLPNLKYLFCMANQLTSLNVNSLTSLQFLSCANNQLTTLEVSALTNLQYLQCQNNMLISLDVSSLINLQYLTCGNNQFTSLNVSALTNILELICDHNLISVLDLSDLTNLQTLHCDSNQLDFLDVSNKPNLHTLHCQDNQLSLLDLSTLTNLQYLWCNNNLLTSLNVSSLINFQYLDCENNQLTSLFVKNGSDETIVFSNNPNLAYICADESQLSSIQNSLNIFGYTNTVLNSYCSFTPGGIFYTIAGNTKLDSNNNGCDISDLGWSNFKFNITDGNTSGSIIADTTGDYSLSVSEGTHTITPIIENPSYFTISPATVSVEFPIQTSPFIQNFCITPNGIHPDLEVTILPIDVARPGFDAHYKIIYKNKGTNTQSGSVNLTFNDAVSDMITANPAISSEVSNNLIWDFTNLQPAESREITFTLNVNTPTETPAVNSGDILNYTTTITSSAIDETPLDNTFTLNQMVVNSFDPNDKTCLEGATITPAMVGKYVHYMIRFENTGTYTAENIVVKDMIDTTKFDVSTLVPTSGSHSFVTRITENNKVEFIFENINLPFEDTSNDGYVAFKIKTKPTLVVGNSFSNTASIYFDYNAPIVTDPATTTIAVLHTPDFEFSTYFNLYPNPATNLLNINLKKEISVSSITIYNTLGQVVLVIPNAQQTKSVDVSSLTTGNYFMKLNTDKGVATAQFIKK